MRVRPKVRHIVMAAAFFCTALFPRCANQVAPQGGPMDSLPPVVRSVTPTGGRNFTARSIDIAFDEYVQLRDLAKEFYTSPLMNTKPTVTIRGRGVRIEIKDTLADNTTYSLNFGGAIADNNEGNPLTDFRYVFSTGPAMDSLLVTGYTAGAMKGDSISKAFVYFFDAATDTIPEYDSVVFNQRPLQVGRTQNNGIFIAQNLREMPYKVYALADNNGNNRYDPGTDMIGFLDSV
ncbi:MAG: Ig-like domain-containing protein, partial [Alistipes sp.]|nr:Ig-like domain-containing protein [Alistipes sp.]